MFHVREKSGMKLKSVEERSDRKDERKMPKYRCGYCDGTGKRSGSSELPCIICGGTGRRSFRLRHKCTFCNGTGRKPGSLALPCPICAGWGYTKKNVRFTPD